MKGAAALKALDGAAGLRAGSAEAREPMAAPAISPATAGLMQPFAKDDFAKDDSFGMGAPRTTVPNRREEVASRESLAVLRENRRTRWAAGGRSVVLWWTRKARAALRPSAPR